MFRSQSGQATLEWLAVVVAIALLVVALPAALRGTLDPRVPIRDALRSVGLIQDPEPASRPPVVIRGHAGDPIIGRFIKGTGSSAKGAAIGKARQTVAEVRAVTQVSGRLGEAFADGFYDELVRRVSDVSLPVNARQAAEAAIAGLWAKTPYAQTVRWGMSGGRVAYEAVIRGSATSAAEVAGREAAGQVVSYLLGGLKRRAGRVAGGERPAPGGPPPGTASTGGFRPPVATP